MSRKPSATQSGQTVPWALKADRGQFTRARGILRRPDEITEFGSARLLSDTTRIDVRVVDIPNPRPQEQILIGDETFLIQGEPRRDRERLIWTIELTPA